ncbi:Fungal transcriptional regulatory N-terminal protein [Rutstroemia sp. NJR-2017a BVV2]|nr:Fungal transcriptional regulatory N-terminal protein [Rutstroemia sp. NJR-2017a BVV2]
MARRVKCDEIHPSCRRCKKAGIDCKGYSPQLQWIDEKPRMDHAKAVARTQEENHAAAQRSFHSMYHASKADRPSYMSQPSELGNLNIPGLPEDLAPVAFKVPMVMAFLTSKLSEGSAPHSKQDINVWVELCSTGGQNSTLYALAAIMFGQAHNSFRMVMEARQAYGKAISDLQVSLLGPKPNESGSSDILSSVTALCMYELADRRSELAWSHHADGLGLLMQRRDPSEFQLSPRRHVFREQRVLLVSRALFSGHGTFLNQPIWKNVPWANDPASKEPLDYLVDILCDAAGYLSEINTPRGINANRVSVLEEEVQASIRTLDSWWKTWSRMYPHICREIPVTPEDAFMTDSTGIVFATKMTYDNLWIAYTVCNYDVARILLLQILQRITEAKESVFPPPFYGSIDSTQHEHLCEAVENKPSPLLGITSDIKGLAHEVFRSIDYINSQSRQFMVSFTSLFIFDVAYYALDARSREAQWLLYKIPLSPGFVSEKRSPVRRIEFLPTCRLCKNHQAFLQRTES